MITEGAVCASVCLCARAHVRAYTIPMLLPFCFSLALIEIHRRNLNEIQMGFMANCWGSGNTQIDLMMIQCISPSNECLIRPLAETIIAA